MDLKCVFRWCLRRLLTFGKTNRLGDRLYLSLSYFRHHRRFPRIRRPQRLNDKMVRRMLFDRNPQLPYFLDKYRVRDHVARRIGEGYLVPLLGLYDRAEEIDFPSLPKEFVLKANHGCAWNYFVTDKDREDLNALHRLAGSWLDSNYYRQTGEWGYKDIPPRIIAEKYMKDSSGYPFPMDFKVACFDGIPRYLVVFVGRGTPGFRAWRFDIENGIPVPSGLTGVYDGGRWIPCIRDPFPVAEGSMIEILKAAAALSLGNDHLRVDFYLCDAKIFFGEMTVYWGAGHMKFRPDDIDFRLGSHWSQPY